MKFTKGNLLQKENRLALYKAALKDYKSKGYDGNLSCGFCWYFTRAHSVRMYEHTLTKFKTWPVVLPELFAQKPEGKMANDSWWPDGAREPRIQDIKVTLVKMIEDENS